MEQKKSSVKSKGIKKTIKIPEGIIVTLEENKIIMEKDGKKIERIVNPLIKVKKENADVIIETKGSKRIERKNIGTIQSHIYNMIIGLDKDYIYRLQFCAVHFPMTVSFDGSKNEFVIKNFLGEKKERIVKVDKNISVKIEKDIITISSYDIEAAGQSAVKLENKIKPTKRDRRIFQDGIYIIEKPNKIYL